MNKQLLLISQEVLNHICDYHRETFNKQLLLCNTEEELIMKMKEIMTDLLLENNEDYLEEVYTYEEYEVFNRKFLVTLKKIYTFEVINQK